MRLVKVRKKVFKREFLDFRLLVVVFDVCEMSQEDENTVIAVNRVYHVIPTAKDTELDIDALLK